VVVQGERFGDLIAGLTRMTTLAGLPDAGTQAPAAP